MAPVAFGSGAAISDLESYYKEVIAIEDSATINYIPCREDYQIISELVKNKLSSKEHLPLGFPATVDGLQAWTASEVEEDDWLVHLSADDIESIERASAAYLGQYDTVDFLSPETFRINEELRSKMQKTVSNLFDGRGFAILRGLDSSKYSPLERVVIFLGLSSYVGNKLGMQTLGKSALSHLTNLKPFYAEGKIKSPGYTNVNMSFHNDTAHIIALFVAGTADNGGASMIASSGQVYNELAESKPHVIKTLAENWKLNRFSTHEFDSEAYYERPLIYYHDGKVILFIARRPFTGSNPGDIPMPLSVRQVEALDAVHFTAETHAIRLHLKEGDLQFLNNLSVIHSRENFKDSSIGEGQGRRHMIRAFLKNEERAFKIPSQLSGAFGEIYPDERGPDWDYLIDPFGTSGSDPVKRGETPPPERPKTPPLGPTGANG